MGQEDATTGIVMELMQTSHYDVIYDPSFTPYRDWGSALFLIASDVAKGMAFIHFNSLFHRDLKPGNVLIDAQWVAKVNPRTTSSNFRHAAFAAALLDSALALGCRDSAPPLGFRLCSAAALSLLSGGGPERAAPLRSPTWAT